MSSNYASFAANQYKPECISDDCRAYIEDMLTSYMCQLAIIEHHIHALKLQLADRLVEVRNIKRENHQEDS